MRVETGFAAIVYVLCTFAAAHAESWSTYRIPETGTAVDIPTSIFTEDSGKPEGYGRRLRSANGSADLTVQAIPAIGESPASFLARKNPPPGIIYKRVTPRFFVVSSVKHNAIWYNRCNFYGHYAHCVLINYPAAEKRQWDGVVTRISHTLRGD
jgi:hypothetical protein